jgi:hypothetical protein
MYSKRNFNFLLFTVVFMFIGKVNSQTQFFRNYYTGTIGEKYKINMDMTFENMKLNGSYSYYSQGKSLGLMGEYDVSGNFNMDESAEEKKTGTIKGNFSNSFSTIKGEWRSADGKKTLPISLEKGAEYITIKDKEVNTSVIYPEFRMKNIPHQEELNKSIAKYMKTYLDTGKAEIKEALEDAGDDTALVSQYSYETGLSVDYISESAASFMGMIYNYSGGAHPNYAYFTKNYFLSPGGIKEIIQTDIFRQNPGYAKMLSDLCIQELKQMQVMGVMNGEITDISEEIRKGSVPFTILQAGLKFYFSPYIIGSYADGSFECIVKYSKIKNVGNFETFLSSMKNLIK